MGVLFVVFVVTSLRGDARDLGGMMSAQAVGGLIGGALCGLLGNSCSRAGHSASARRSSARLTWRSSMRRATSPTLPTLPRLPGSLRSLCWRGSWPVRHGRHSRRQRCSLACNRCCNCARQNAIWAGSSARSAPAWRCSASREQASRAGWGTLWRGHAAQHPGRGLYRGWPAPDAAHHARHGHACARRSGGGGMSRRQRLSSTALEG